MKQISYQKEQATLYLVPTPIGNKADMTNRCCEVLQCVDIIACEDKRVSVKLLDSLGVHKPLMVNQKFNEDSNVETFMQLLDEGKSIALISDAGMPCISDPGYTIVYQLVNKGYNVVPLPGANAALTALMASGIDSARFTFIGFLPANKSGREKELTLLKDRSETLIFYEAVHRIMETLRSMLEVLGDRNVCVARELTKLHETIYRGKFSEIIEQMDVKGEYVIVVEGNSEVNKESTSIDVTTCIKLLLDEGISVKSASKVAAALTGIPKNQCYQMASEFNKS